MAIVGTTTGNELDWAAHFYLPFEIEPRDGFHLGVNHGWLEEQFRGDNAVFLRVETWDGETIESEQHPLEAG